MRPGGDHAIDPVGKILCDGEPDMAAPGAPVLDDSIRLTEVLLEQIQHHIEMRNLSRRIVEAGPPALVPSRSRHRETLFEKVQITLAVRTRGIVEIPDERLVPVGWNPHQIPRSITKRASLLSVGDLGSGHVRHHAEHDKEGHYR